MEFNRGRVVLSKAGRDKGRFMAVSDVADGYIFVIDGDERPLERPKRKNKHHLALTKTVLSEHSMSTNRSLRKALRELEGSSENE